MFFDILILIFAMVGVMFFVRLAVRLLLKPTGRNNYRYVLAVTAKGEVPELEQVMRSAKWSADESLAELVLVDLGVGPQAYNMARRLSRELGFRVLGADDFASYIGGGDYILRNGE